MSALREGTKMDKKTKKIIILQGDPQIGKIEKFLNNIDSLHDLEDLKEEIEKECSPQALENKIKQI
jgi:hypothetical protein